MEKPYRYCLRPAFGSDELLLEFLLDNSDADFAQDLFTTLKDIHPKVESVEDLWMNDEVLLHVSSDKGRFTLSIDIWGFAFIMAEQNQRCIELIHLVLSKSHLFTNEEVDFENYRNLDS